MKVRWKLWILFAFMVFLIPSLVLGQSKTSTNVINLFSVWVKLSLVGYSQSEIESTLVNVDPQLLSQVKQRVRLNVINNLRSTNLPGEIEIASTEQELSLIRNKINTEIRFAGMENDTHLRWMIRKHFGIAINRI